MKNDVFALLNDGLIHISKAIKGELNYSCCKCKEQLIVRDGEKNIKHFSHKSDSNCKGGLETSIHLFAKNVLENSKKINLPNPDVSKINIPFEYEFDTVICEETFDEIKPDITTIKNNQKLFIEIAVTHRIDEIKKNKIREKIKIPTIEIYLENEIYDEKKLRDRILNSLSNKEWIYNHSFNEEINALKKLVTELQNEKTSLISENQKIKNQSDVEQEKLTNKCRELEEKYFLFQNKKINLENEYVGKGSTSTKEKYAKYITLWLDKAKLRELPTNDKGQITLKMWKKKQQDQYSEVVVFNVAIDEEAYPNFIKKK